MQRLLKALGIGTVLACALAKTSFAENATLVQENSGVFILATSPGATFHPGEPNTLGC